MTSLLNQFYLFSEARGKNSDRVRELHGKIYGRMSHIEDCMRSSDFYGINLDLYKKDINYHIIYINDERKTNRDSIEQVLNGYRLPITSLNAKDSNQLNEFNRLNPEFKKAWDGFKDGELGNFGSHFLAWKYLVNSNLDHILVFEDDAKIHEDFVYKYNILLNSVPKDYDVMSVFVDPNQYPRYASKDYVNEYVAKGYQDWSTLCYFISRQGAEKLIKYVTEIGMDHPTDWFIFRKGHVGTFNVYTVPPEFPSPLEIDHSYESQVQ
jgi:GR25 family glycosyltransferase involved in LPS biosynthesis